MRCNIPFTCYSDRLHKLNIQSLQYRRLEYDLKITYKICYGLIDINFDNFFKYCSSPYELRRHRLTLQSIGKPKHKNVANFFSHRVVLYGIAYLSMLSLRLHYLYSKTI